MKKKRTRYSRLKACKGCGETFDTTGVAMCGPCLWKEEKLRDGTEAMGKSTLLLTKPMKELGLWM